MKWGFPISISLLFWFIVGILRRIDERISKIKGEVVLFIATKKYKEDELKRIAVCIAAKNEENSIKKTINSVKKNTSLKHCYVISDGSTDKTAEVAKKAGCRTVANKTSRGKARALKKLFKSFSLLKKYDFILFLDADTKLDKNYIKRALRVFEDEKIAALSGYAKTDWSKQKNISLKNYFIAYRARLYSSLQFFYFYGQTWKKTNATSIIPGFASIYRTSVLKKLDIAVPRMAIEDFNWTFQVRKKKLGLIAHHPSIFATAQDPTTLKDYITQIERWNIGFFQAVRYNGIWWSFFWFFLLVFMLEVLINSIFFGLLPFLVIFLLFSIFTGYFDPFLTEVGSSIETVYTLGGIFFGVIIIDYLLTAFVAFKDKRPMLLFYGLGFIFLRFIDSMVLIGVLERFFFVKTEGVWRSPKRQ